MNFNVKIRSAVAAVSAAAMFISSSPAAIAATFGYSDADNIRMKALTQYLTSSPVVLAMEKDEPTIVQLAKDAASPIGTVTYAEASETEEIAFDTVKRMNNELEKGKTVTVREGVPGVKVKTYNVKYVNGVEKSRELTGEYVQTAPVDKIVEYGNKVPTVAVAGGNTLSYKYVLECEATAYDMSPEENGGYGDVDQGY